MSTYPVIYNCTMVQPNYYNIREETWLSISLSHTLTLPICTQVTWYAP